MAEKKITKRERFEEIKSVLTTVEGSEELVTFIEEQIAAIDKRNEADRKRTAEKKAEPDPLKDAIYATLTEDFKSLAEIIATVDYTGDIVVTKAKVVARLTALAKEGLIEKDSAKLEGESRKVTVYRRA